MQCIFDLYSKSYYACFQLYFEKTVVLVGSVRKMLQMLDTFHRFQFLKIGIQKYLLIQKKLKIH